MDMMNYIIWKYFYRKPEEILSFLMILDENPNFPPKFVKNLHIFKIVINYLKNNKRSNFVLYLIFLFYLTCFTTVPIFKSIGPLVAEIWGGGGAKMPPPPPPPPMDSSPQNNPMGLGLRKLNCDLQDGQKQVFTIILEIANSVVWHHCIYTMISLMLWTWHFAKWMMHSS